MNEEEIDLYERANKLWGKNFQMDMVIEECSELIKAIIKYKRIKITSDKLISEMVDVQIMLNQMRIIMNDESKWERITEYKLDRLKGIIEEGERNDK